MATLQCSQLACSRPFALGARQGRINCASYHRRRTVLVSARFGGGNVLDRPVTIERQGWDSDKDWNIGTLPPLTDTGRDSGNTDRSKGAPPGGGDYRILLLNSPKHTEPIVVKAITSVVPNTDENHAKNCYHTSKQLGMAIVTTCLKEHAEFYQQQLYGMGCRVSIEPDSSVA